MKKSFKTIMALTAALAISMSGMAMTSADEDTTPPQSPMTVNGDSTTGKFDPVNPIPVIFGAEHLLSVTIDFGNMAMSYDLTDTSEANNYGWGDSFDGTNNKLTITNNSTCPVLAVLAAPYLNTETYPFLEKCFCFTETNDNGNPYDGLSFVKFLSYAGDQTEGAEISDNFYLNLTNTAELTDMHNYQFNNAKIGEITIELTPLSTTIPTEKGCYVSVLRVDDLNSFYSILTEWGYSEEEVISIFFTVERGTPYYLGPYETEDEANSIKTQLDESSTCSIIHIS